MIDEQRALAAKAVRHNDDRSQMLFGQKVSDLIGGIKTDRFEYPYGKDLRILQPRHSGHQLRNTLRHGIGYLRITRGSRRDENSCSQSHFVECRGAFEDEVVRIEVLHEDDVAWPNLLCTHEALPYLQHPEPACHRHEKHDKQEQRQPEFPRRSD